MTPAADTRRTVIIGPPPTPNGDLHLGHLAGPYLAADVHARYLRAAGRPVLYATGTDDSQTYVTVTAARRGLAPEQLAARSWHDIRATLAATGVHVDGFAPFDDAYRAMVLDFVTRLHRNGKLELRSVTLPWARRAGTFLVEGMVQGGCPVCLAVSRGGLCETCGHPNTFDDLLDPRSTLDPDDEFEPRPAQVLVLPLERYRDRLTAYHAGRGARWRPRIARLMAELLARPLPDFPVTYPLAWGIPAPFAETPGQVLNAWVEGMPASMVCTAHAQRETGETPAADDELWRAEQDVRLVYFLGFDNAYFWALTHLALLMAHDGRYVLPDTIVPNEFYELENEKFSTSLGHVIWARELVSAVPRDLVRFALAASAPEFCRTNFSAAAARHVTGTRLVRPWNALAARVEQHLHRLGGPPSLPTTAEGRELARITAARFEACYELAGFSLQLATDLVVQHVQRLADAAAGADLADADLGDLFLQLGVLVEAASPVLVDLSDAARRAGSAVRAFPSALAASARRVTPFPVPRLAAWAADGDATVLATAGDVQEDLSCASA